MTNGMRASGSRMTLTRGQKNSCVTMPKARRLIRMLRPNNALLSIWLTNEGSLQCRREDDFVLLQHRRQDVLQLLLPQLPFVESRFQRLARKEVRDPAHEEEAPRLGPMRAHLDNHASSSGPSTPAARICPRWSSRLPMMH